MGTVFPETKEKERKVEVIRRKKTTKHEEETNHSRREYKATGTRRKTGLRLERMEKLDNA